MSDINHAGSDLIFELEDRPPFHQALVGATFPSVGNFRSDGNPRVNLGAALRLPLKQLPILFQWR